MTAVTVSFRWLDILEKEFDKAFVDLELIIGDLSEYDDYNGYRKSQARLQALSSCFAQLTHKAQTIFQSNAKLEAELVHLRREAAESSAELLVTQHQQQQLQNKMHALLPAAANEEHQQQTLNDKEGKVSQKQQQQSEQILQKSLKQNKQQEQNLQQNQELQQNQQCEQQVQNRKQDQQIQNHQRDQNNLQQDENSKENRETIIQHYQKIPQKEQESQQHEVKCTLLSRVVQAEELRHLHGENTALRRLLLSMQGELCGARLAAKYLDKELAGRIQQLQLLGREVRWQQDNDKLWRQLEAEINLHRHKTVVRACRANIPANNGMQSVCETAGSSDNYGSSGDEAARVAGSGSHHYTAAGGVVDDDARPQPCDYHRTVTIQKTASQSLGMSVTGGREHGVPIVVSVVHPNTPASRCGNLYVGDAILAVDGHDLTQMSHTDAVGLLSRPAETVTLQLMFVPPEDDDTSSLPDDPFAFKYRLFDDDVLSVTSSVVPCVGSTRAGAASAAAAVAATDEGRLSRASLDSIRGSQDDLTLDNMLSDEEAAASDINSNCDSTTGGDDHLKIQPAFTEIVTSTSNISELPSSTCQHTRLPHANSTYTGSSEYNSAPQQQPQAAVPVLATTAYPYTSSASSPHATSPLNPPVTNIKNPSHGTVYPTQQNTAPAESPTVADAIARNSCTVSCSSPLPPFSVTPLLPCMEPLSSSSYSTGTSVVSKSQQQQQLTPVHRKSTTNFPGSASHVASAASSPVKYDKRGGVYYYNMGSPLQSTNASNAPLATTTITTASPATATPTTGAVPPATGAELSSDAGAANSNDVVSSLADPASAAVAPIPNGDAEALRTKNMRHLNSYSSDERNVTNNNSNVNNNSLGNNTGRNKSMQTPADISSLVLQTPLEEIERRMTTALDGTAVARRDSVSAAEVRRSTALNTALFNGHY